MEENGLGYTEFPPNGDGIVRAITTKQLRSWEIPRSDRALGLINAEFGKVDYPGLYVLMDSKSKKMYVGEAKSVLKRLQTHNKSPEEKIKNWDRCLIINDGRAAAISDFNDAGVRKALEDYLAGLLKINKYIVVCECAEQTLNATQANFVNSFIRELNFFLIKKNLISKLTEKIGQNEIMPDELRGILLRKGHTLANWRVYEGDIDGSKAYIRPGSKKTKGWQVTFRDKFKETLQNGVGYLLVPRGNILLIPFKEILKVIKDKNAFKQNTIDVYLEFKEKGVFLKYKDDVINISEFCILTRRES